MPGRKKICFDKMLAGFAAGTFALIEKVQAPGEDRKAFVRKAVDAEIARRMRGVLQSEAAPHPLKQET